MTRTIAAILALFAAGAAAAPAAAAPAADTANLAGEARQMLADVVAMRTAAGFGKVPEMAAYLAQRFNSAGFAGQDIEIMPMGETAAMIVRYRSPKPTRRPVLFLGHMDVVDAHPEDWQRDPFTLTEADGLLFGRGALDNKHGIVNLAQAFIELKRQGFVPDRDLIIAFSGDEETTMLTTRALVERLAPERPEFALNSDAGGGFLGPDGKPLAYMMQVAEKTYATFELVVRNPGGHSSRPRTDNAIYDLAGALKRIEAHRFPVRSNAVTRAFFAATGAATPGEAGVMMRRFAANPDDAAAAEALAADPSSVGFTRTTCIATMLDAGHAENALPQRAAAKINCRIFPGETVDAVRAALADAADLPGSTWSTLGQPTTSPVSEPRPDVTAALKAAVDKRYPGLPIVPYMESGGTDGMHFRNVGIPTYAISSIFMKQSDLFAHGLDERVPAAAFTGGLDHWPTIIRAVAGVAK